MQTAVIRRGSTHPEYFRSGLMMRLRAEVGLHQLSTLGDYAAATADPVGAWVDNYNPRLLWSQVTAGKRPTLLNLATPAGGPCVRFVSANSSVLQQTSSAFLTQSHTVLAVLRLPIAPTATQLVLANGTTNWQAGFTLSTTNPIFRTSYAKTDTTQRAANSAIGIVQINQWAVAAWSVELTGTDPTARYYWNTTMEEDLFAGEGITVPTGTSWALGAASSAASFLDMDLAEINVWCPALAPADLQAVVYDRMARHQITP